MEEIYWKNSKYSNIQINITHLEFNFPLNRIYNFNRRMKQKLCWASQMHNWSKRNRACSERIAAIIERNETPRIQTAKSGDLYCLCKDKIHPKIVCLSQNMWIRNTITHQVVGCSEGYILFTGHYCPQYRHIILDCEHLYVSVIQLVGAGLLWRNILFTTTKHH